MKFLTFDIEDYHHLLDLPGLDSQYDETKSVIPEFLDILLPLLEKSGVTAIFFVLGEVAERFPGQVKRIVEAGHLVGSHSHSHSLHNELSDSQFRDDLEKSIKAISSVTGAEVKCYRAPGFSLTESYASRFDILSELGIKYDFSLFEGAASHGGIEDLEDQNPIEISTPSGSILSYPFRRTSLFGRKIPITGGGYFRLIPGWIINRSVRNQDYVMTYFHPRDFIRSQPRLKGLSVSRYFKAYVGIASATAKLNSILRSTEWDGGEYLYRKLTHV